MQPVFPVMKLKPLFAGINPLKNVLQINSKAHLDWLAGKAWVWASKIYNVLVGKFGKVNWVDDIYNVAKNIKDVNLSKGAEVIIWEKEVAVSIMERLKKIWWKDISTPWAKDAWITTLSKWTEKIDFREKANSQITWYTHKMTLDLYKQLSWSKWREIKFVTK